ncbi:transposase [Clostridium botulinum]|uniref:transposase n=1 Tax=Clostridium botulinum TaxID=1491 RepID=UPI0021DA4FC0|nr:transposase [Clostridium botulinum]
MEKYDSRLYFYCLMTNHVHLTIQTGEIKISEIMKIINELYTKYFNNKYNLVGHLFQGRYNWKFIANDKCLLEVSRYVHLNPVTANIVKKPEEYHWSSYPMIIGEKKEKLIDSNKILSYFNENNKRKSYKNFVESDIKTRLD